MVSVCPPRGGETSLTVNSPGPIVTSTQFALPSNSSGSGLLPVTVKSKFSGRMRIPNLTSLQTDNVAGSSGGSISISFVYSNTAKSSLFDLVIVTVTYRRR